MPCSAKKFECNRPEMCQSGYKDVDYGLTTRELAKMIREAGIDLPKMPPSDFDDPFGTATGSGVIFGATGGVMEAALRTVLEIVTGKRIEKLFDHADIIPLRGFEGVRYAEIPVTRVGPVPDLIAHLFTDFDWLRGATLKVAVCHGTANARKVMENIVAGGPLAQCHFIEFMACPGGCLGGGGQPIPTSPSIRAARQSDLRRGQGIPSPQIAREPGDCAALPAVLDRRAVRPQEPRSLAHALHAARQVHRLKTHRGLSRFSSDENGTVPLGARGRGQSPASAPLRNSTSAGNPARCPAAT